MIFNFRFVINILIGKVLRIFTLFVLLYAFIALVSFNSKQYQAQSQSQISTEIQSLLQENRLEELLELLSAAPEGLSAGDLYYFRIIALSGLDRYEEAIKQARAGFRITKSVDIFGVIIVELYIADGQFELAQVFIDVIRNKYANMLKSNKRLQQRINDLESQNNNYDGYNFSFTPTFSPEYNVKNETSQKTLNNLADLGRNIPAIEYTDGWSLGFNFNASFVYYTKPAEYFLAFISTSSTFKRGSSFSSLKTYKYDSNSQRLLFLFAMPVSKSFSFSPNISYDRSFDPAGAFYANNLVTLNFGFVNFIDNNTRLEVSPLFGYTFYDNPQEPQGSFAGVSTKINFGISNIAGGRAGIGTTIIFRQFNIVPAKRARSNMTLGVEFSMNPQDFANIRLSFNPRISYHQYNGFDSINNIPRLDVSYGMLTVITFAMIPLIGDSFFPTLTINVKQTHSTAPYVEGSDFSISLGITAN